METIRVALAQINPTVGDLEGNAALIIKYLEKARGAGADLAATPELAIPGYPPEDLLLKPQFIKDNRKALDKVIAASAGLIAVVGFVDSDGSDIYNAAAVIANGKLLDVYRKVYLPNYGVFDEERYFQRGNRSPVYVIGQAKIGVNICEDIWYPAGPTKVQALEGDAHLIVNISSSPYHASKHHDRERMLCTRAEDNAVALAYCNLIGGQDELVFDGNSLIIDEAGHIVARGRPFDEDLVIADISVERVFSGRLHDPRRRRDKTRGIADESLRLINVEVAPKKDARPVLAPRHVASPGKIEEIYAALVTGTGDCVRKNGFDKVYIGLSGGIDSALTAVIATDALGPENIRTVYLPTRYSADASARDSRLLAENLGVAYHVIPIEQTFAGYLAMLEPVFDGLKPDETEENLQARIRGNILMALSNKYRGLVLSTGNKSEMSVGYSTLYGDMVGGFCVLKDVFKTTVYELAEYVNRRRPKPVIPEYIITRAPSAELRPEQTDQDTLPPYPVLDAILKAYIEKDMSSEAIVGLGYDASTVRWVIDRVDYAEYKRRQAPPGVKITTRAFGRDRRMPITNRYHN